MGSLRGTGRKTETTSPYAYVVGNPLGYRDPNGMQEQAVEVVQPGKRTPLRMTLREATEKYGPLLTESQYKEYQERAKAEVAPVKKRTPTQTVAEIDAEVRKRAAAMYAKRMKEYEQSRSATRWSFQTNYYLGGRAQASILGFDIFEDLGIPPFTQHGVSQSGRWQRVRISRRFSGLRFRHQTQHGQNEGEQAIS